MITQQEAEALAQKCMQDYIAECKCDDVDEVGKALMTLVSMCGIGMCATVGQQEATARLYKTAAYILKTQSGKKWKMERAN